MTQINLTRPDLLRDACYIGGEWVGAGNGPSIPVSNPSTGKTIVSVPKFGRRKPRPPSPAPRPPCPPGAPRPARNAPPSC